MHPPPSPGQANFTLMTECTPESRRYYSVYSVRATTAPLSNSQHTHRIGQRIWDKLRCLLTWSSHLSSGGSGDGILHMSGMGNANRM
jgi:hypothetical protein